MIFYFQSNFYCSIVKILGEGWDPGGHYDNLRMYLTHIALIYILILYEVLLCIVLLYTFTGKSLCQNIVFIGKNIVE